MLGDREAPGVIALNESALLIAGGRELEHNRRALSTSEILNLHTMKYSVGPEMRYGRAETWMIDVDVGRALVIGGIGDQAVASTEV